VITKGLPHVLRRAFFLEMLGGFRNNVYLCRTIGAKQKQKTRNKYDDIPETMDVGRHSGLRSEQRDDGESSPMGEYSFLSLGGVGGGVSFLSFEHQA
jgi:hypothetical protein